MNKLFLILLAVTLGVTPAMSATPAGENAFDFQDPSGGASLGVIKGNGDFLPDGDATQDLGATAKRWANIYATMLEMADGNAGAPSMGFANDTDTGFSRQAGGTVLYSADGTPVLAFTPTGFTVMSTMTVQGVAELQGILATAGVAVNVSGAGAEILIQQTADDFSNDPTLFLRSGYDGGAGGAGLGKLLFEAKDDGGTNRVFHSIQLNSVNHTAAGYDGRLQFESSVDGGAISPRFSIEPDGSANFVGLVDMDAGLTEAGSNTLSNDISGNAATATSATSATSLASNGTNCSANQFNKGVDASGNAESCSALVDADVPDSITITGLSGTNTGDQTITLTGDVTGSGTGSFSATVANDAITTSKLATDAVSEAKILNGSVTTEKLHPDVQAQLGGGGGGVGLGDNNVWTSTNTYGPASDVTNMHYGSIIKGGRSEIAATIFDDVSSVNFTQILSSHTTYIQIRGRVKTANGAIRLTIDGDTGASNYEWGTHRVLSNNTNEGSGGNPNAYCGISGSSLVRQDNEFMFEIKIARSPGSANERTIIEYRGSFILSDTNRASAYGTCFYNPSGTGDGEIDVEIFPSAGDITGVASVYAEVSGLAW